MICFRKIKEEDFDKVKEILLEENISNLQVEGIIYVVIENDEILGVGKVKEENKKWFLEYLITRKNKRGNRLGDGLLRVLANNLFRNGIDKLYCQEKNEFLLKKGFRKNDENLYELNIEELFDHNCNNCGG